MLLSKEKFVLAGILSIVLVYTVFASINIIGTLYVSEICLNGKCIQDWKNITHPLEKKINELSRKIEELNKSVRKINIILEQGTGLAILKSWDQCYDGKYVRSPYCVGAVPPVCSPYAMLDLGSIKHITKIRIVASAGNNCCCGFCIDMCPTGYNQGGYVPIAIMYSTDGKNWKYVPVLSITGGGRKCFEGQVQTVPCCEFKEINITTDIYARYIIVGRGSGWGPARGEVLIDCVQALS